MTTPTPSPQFACLWCLTPTGLRTGAEGSPAWVTGYLVSLGLSWELAEAAVSGQWAGDGRITMFAPICAACAWRVGVETALGLAGLDVPTVRQPEGGQA